MFGNELLRRPLGALKRKVRSFLLDDVLLNGASSALSQNGNSAPTNGALTNGAPATPSNLPHVRPDPLSQIGVVWSGSGPENMILIAGLARATRAKRYLEIGAYRGFTAGWVRWACPDIEIHAVDNWQRANTSAAQLLDGVQKIGGSSANVFAHEGDSFEQLNKLIGMGLSFDLIYVDGNHTYEYAKGDFERALELLSPTGTIVIDDTVTWWGPRELSEELQNGKMPANFHFLEIQSSNGLLIMRRQPKVKPPLEMTRENCPDGVWHDDASKRVRA